MIVTCLVEPGHFRQIHSFVQQSSEGQGRLEVVSLAAIDDSDSSAAFNSGTPQNLEPPNTNAAYTPAPAPATATADSAAARYLFSFSLVLLTKFRQALDQHELINMVTLMHNRHCSCCRHHVLQLQYFTAPNQLLLAS